MMDQKEMANEMRRAAQAIRSEAPHLEHVAKGNELIAEYIEGLECGLAAERNLSARRTQQRDEARAEAERLRARIALLQPAARLANCDHHFESDPGMWDTQHRYCKHCGVAE